MKYIVRLNSNGDAQDFNIIADSPKTATLTAIHRVMNNNLNVVESWVENFEGNAWYYKIKVNHNTRKLELLEKKTLR
jgi:hypothetical protein